MREHQQRCKPAVYGSRSAAIDAAAPERDDRAVFSATRTRAARLGSRLATLCFVGVIFYAVTYKLLLLVIFAVVAIGVATLEAAANARKRRRAPSSGHSPTS